MYRLSLLSILIIRSTTSNFERAVLSLLRNKEKSVMLYFTRIPCSRYINFYCIPTTYPFKAIYNFVYSIVYPPTYFS